MLKLFKIFLFLVLLVSFIPTEGFCNDHAVGSHQCSLTCATCCSVIVPASSNVFLRNSFPVVKVISTYSFLYSNPTRDGLKRPPVFLS